MKVKLLSRVRLSDPMDCSLPGSSVHGVFQARVLEWGAIAFSDCIHIRNTYIYIVYLLIIKYSPLSTGHIVEALQWMPEITDNTKPSVRYAFFQYVHTYDKVSIVS